MEKHNYVCFECRMAVRRSPADDSDIRCPSCGTECAPLGCELSIPAKTKLKEWKKLKASYESWLSSRAGQQPGRSGRRKKFLLKRIAEVSQYSGSVKSQSELIELQRELETYND